MSSKKNIIISIAILVVAAGIGTYAYFNRPVAAPSAPIDQLQPSANNTTEAAKNIFDIRQNDSEVSFTLNEVLRGEPTVVVGVTDQVAGQIVFDPENPSAAQMGTVRVNARTLVTDNPQRNGAIARLILESEKSENELITFAPTKIEGMPSRVTMGSSFNVKITGNLKIRDITKETTFTGSVTLAAADRLTTDLSATVKRADFNLVIPNIPFVANVQEEVTLRVKATAVSGGSAGPMEGDSAISGMEQEIGHAAGETETETEPSVTLPATAGVQEIVVTGSNFKFSPAAITVNKGQKVRLTFKNSGGNHDFVIDELGVSARLLKNGEEQVVEFTPSKTGAFEFYCSVGSHRAMGMTGIITVR